MAMSSPDSTIPQRRLWVPLTLLSTVYLLARLSRIEYGAARCSAKWTTASGRLSTSSASRPS